MKNSNLQSLIIFPDSSAPSFCYYNSGNIRNEVMSAASMEKCITFCEENQLSATVVYGKNLLDEHHRLLEGFPHIRILPLEYIHDYNEEAGDIIVVDYTDLSVFDSFPEKKKYHVILRINRENLKYLPMLIYQYHSLFSRLNVVVKDIAGTNEDALNRMRLDMQPLKNIMFQLFIDGELFELNMLTDRMMLEKSKSCDAGILHLTFAPDGQFYLCPAFYYDDKKLVVGSLEEGIHIPNSHLLQIEQAPLCRSCDCYQCKRCIWLNKLLTGELNTPSHEQCVASHHERNLSGMLLQKLQNKGVLNSQEAIPPLYYLDPLEYFRDKIK